MPYLQPSATILSGIVGKPEVIRDFQHFVARPETGLWEVGRPLQATPLKLALMGHCPRASGTRGSRITRQHLHRSIVKRYP
jgi:hypothetical protein